MRSTRVLALKSQARTINGKIPGSLSAKKERKKLLLAALDSMYTKDYSEAFNGVEDMYSLFCDATHFSGEGNRIIAGLLAEDILKEFAHG